jgi:transposase
MARPGHERFTSPTLAAQRRYETLRAYWVEELSAGEIAERFGYGKASVQTLISRYRGSDLAELFAAPRPGPKRQPKKDAARERVIELRRLRHGIEEIVAELERAGTPLSRTAVWEILRDEGLSRMPRPAAPPETGPAPELLSAAKVHVLADGEWPETGSVQTQHAGLFLLVPDLVALDLPGLVEAAGWPSTIQLEATRSVLSLLALKLAGRRRRSHVQAVVHDPALGLFCGLNALPKTWHLKTYSYRTTRAQQVSFFEALQPRLRKAGLLGEAGLNLDFHAIMSYGEDTVLDEHYVPRRSQRTRSVLTFIAQDGQEHTVLYANAELTARQQSGEVISFCRFYQRSHGELPKLLVFDGKLTTQQHLAELDELGVGFITLRQRHPKLIESLQTLPQSAWTKTRLDRAGKHKTASYHEQQVTINQRSFRQLAVRGLGHQQPTLILTNQRGLTPKQLIERYAKRWGIENQLSEQIRAFHLDSLSSQVPLAVDSDVALTILADTIYRHFTRGLHTTYRRQTPDTIRSYLIDGIGELRFTPSHIEIALRRRTHTPTPPHSSTPTTKTAKPKSPGGADAPSATASPPDNPRKPQLN